MDAEHSPRGSALTYYTKLAVHMGVPFGLGMGLMDGIPGGWRVGLLTGVLAGTFFGIFMSLALGTAARRATRRMGPGALEVLQKRVLMMHGASREVLDLAAQAMATLPHVRHVHVDVDGRTARARTSMNWNSFGEEVSLHVEGVEGGYCRVCIKSRPRIKATVVDYGVNTTNVEALAESLGRFGKVVIGTAPIGIPPVVGRG